jgi:hypothetical protein
MWQPQHFACDRCGKLLCRPVVLTCGHVVCGPTCLQPLASGSAEAYQCPACALVTRHPAAVCRQLADLLAELFPDVSREREGECRHALEQQEAAQPSSSNAQAFSPTAQGCKGQGQQEQQRAEGGPAGPGEGGGQDPGTPRAAAAGSAAGPLESDEVSSERPAQQQQQQQALSPSLASALRRRQAEGGPSQQVAERLESNLRRLTGDSYVHHGVGCDGCGEAGEAGMGARAMPRPCHHACSRRHTCRRPSTTALPRPAGLYPIQGRRYQCCQCPDAMGFDLCGACMDRGVSDIVGRFNQRHTPDHSMRLVRPRITAMHMLQVSGWLGFPAHCAWLYVGTLCCDVADAGARRPWPPCTWCAARRPPTRSCPWSSSCGCWS